MKHRLPVLAMALGLLAMCVGCASVTPALPLPDGIGEDASEDRTDSAPLLDVQDVYDASADTPSLDRETNSSDVPREMDAPSDIPSDPPDTSDADARDSRDAPSDWPTVLLHIASGESCNALRIHNIVRVVRRAEPFTERLSGGTLREGVYHLTDTIFYPSEGYRSTIYNVFGMTLRVIGTRIEVAYSFHSESLFPSGIGRYSCRQEARPSRFMVCAYTCPNEKLRNTWAPIEEYEATPDQVRIWYEPFLHTFRWMGPP